MSTNTPRFAMPFLMVAQAHKEITHNEALLMLDGLVHASVVGVSSTPPSLAEADAGKCWLIAAPASGSWSGMEDAIASWTGASWRFLSPVPGMAVWNMQDGYEMRYVAGEWLYPASVSAPAGGLNVDSECRNAMNSLLVHLRDIGIIGA